MAEDIFFVKVRTPYFLIIPEETAQIEAILSRQVIKKKTAESFENQCFQRFVNPTGQSSNFFSGLKRLFDLKSVVQVAI